MLSDLPRRYKAAYAGSMAAEIKKNVQLDPGEEIVFSASVQIRRNWLLMQPGILALTPHRLILLEHFLLSPDWILEIPRAAIVNLSFDQGAGSRWLDVSYIGPNSTELLRLRPLAFRGRPSSGEFSSLFDSLQKFRAGQLNSSSVQSSARHHEASAHSPSYSSLTLFAILCLVLIFRIGQYYVKLPSEWHAKQAYDATPSCASANLVANDRTETPSSPPATSSFCGIQEMTIFRVWSTRRAPYQHVALMDSRGKTYDDVGALNSVDTAGWLRMRPGEQVRVLAAGDLPAWILHNGDLFETRESPDHNFREQFTLMLAGTAVLGLLLAFWIYYFRQTFLARSHAARSHAATD